MWQLENTNFYYKLSMNPTIEYNTKINTVKDNFRKHILTKEKTANSLTIENPKTPTFYTSIKIHKKETLEDLLLTPSTHKQVTFVDHYLQPLLQKLLSYVKDTPDVHISMKTRRLLY